MEQHTTINIEEREPLSYEPPCIFRVHVELRHANEKVYTSLLVFIGPYHHGQPKLLAMEKHKERYLELLLQRNNNQSVELYLDCMKKLENSTRKQICNDLMLLENQLPLFVITEFFDMSYSMTMSMTQNPKQNHPSPTLTELAIHSVACTLPRESDIHRINFENMPLSKSKHFLDLVHNVFLPSSGDDESDDCQNNNSKFVYNQRTCYKMPCVIELQDSGVKFGAEEDDDELNLSMFDIYFEHGHFKIPKFNVDDWTETFFHNIIAYEQHSSDDEPKYFSNYTYFMDLLINTEEDVDQLRHHDILDNWLNDDKKE
ncbi:unnamed protein product [Camellia sinensis]